MLSGLKDAREVITEERDNNDGVKRKIDYNVSPSQKFVNSFRVGDQFDGEFWLAGAW